MKLINYLKIIYYDILYGEESLYGEAKNRTDKTNSTMKKKNMSFLEEMQNLEYHKFCKTLDFIMERKKEYQYLLNKTEKPKVKRVKKLTQKKSRSVNIANTTNTLKLIRNDSLPKTLKRASSFNNNKFMCNINDDEDINVESSRDAIDSSMNTQTQYKYSPSPQIKISNKFIEPIKVNFKLIDNSTEYNELKPINLVKANSNNSIKTPNFKPSQIDILNNNDNASEVNKDKCTSFVFNYQFNQKEEDLTRKNTFMPSDKNVNNLYTSDNNIALIADFKAEEDIYPIKNQSYIIKDNFKHPDFFSFKIKSRISNNSENEKSHRYKINESERSKSSDNNKTFKTASLSNFTKTNFYELNNNELELMFMTKDPFIHTVVANPFRENKISLSSKAHTKIKRESFSPKNDNFKTFKSEEDDIISVDKQFKNKIKHKLITNLNSSNIKIMLAKQKLRTNSLPKSRTKLKSSSSKIINIEKEESIINTAPDMNQNDIDNLNNNNLVHIKQPNFNKLTNSNENSISVSFGDDTRKIDTLLSPSIIFKSEELTIDDIQDSNLKENDSNFKQEDISKKSSNDKKIRGFNFRNNISSERLKKSSIQNKAELALNNNCNNKSEITTRIINNKNSSESNTNIPIKVNKEVIGGNIKKMFKHNSNKEINDIYGFSISNSNSPIVGRKDSGMLDEQNISLCSIKENNLLNSSGNLKIKGPFSNMKK